MIYSSCWTTNDTTMRLFYYSAAQTPPFNSRHTARNESRGGLSSTLVCLSIWLRPMWCQSAFVRWNIRLIGSVATPTTNSSYSEQPLLSPGRFSVPLFFPWPTNRDRQTDIKNPPVTSSSGPCTLTVNYDFHKFCTAPSLFMWLLPALNASLTMTIHSEGNNQLTIRFMKLFRPASIRPDPVNRLISFRFGNGLGRAGEEPACGTVQWWLLWQNGTDLY